ncbi:MAG: GldG family protein [Defluviitaleaceae bacterium]|nr:GldG family protein [Defluviitaleaceae bacterium]
MFDKRFLYGTFSTAMMLFAAVIFVLVNLLAGEFNFSRDLTAEQIFSLSDDSREFLAGLEDDVTITFIAHVGREHEMFLGSIISGLLEEYTAASPRIRTEQRDPLLNPALIHRFAAESGVAGGIIENTVVVQSDAEIRVILPHEMLVIQGDRLNINVEREITRAIEHVTQGSAGVIYYVIGSGEPSLPPEFIAFLESENYTMREVNLVAHDVPDDADILFIPMPSRDWTEIKAGRVRDFLAGEGSAFFALDYMHEPMPHLAAVLDAYGLAHTGRFIFEDDAQNLLDLRMLGMPIFVLPEPAAHEITQTLLAHDFVNVLPFFPAEIRIQPVRRTTLTIEPLWTTSRAARAYEIDDDLMGQPPEQSNEAPFPLAVAVTDRIFLGGNEYFTRIVATSNIEFIGPLYAANFGEGNWHFVLNSLRWMSDEPPAVWIPSRVPPGHSPVFIDDSAANMIGIAAMAGIPLLCIALGAAVWLKRRFG